MNHSPVTTDDEEGEERDEWECEGLVAEGGVAVPILFSEDGRCVDGSALSSSSRSSFLDHSEERRDS